MPRFDALAFALAAAGLLGVPGASAQPSFTGLGDIPGGTFRSIGYAVSADGAVAAGLSTGSTTSSGVEAFRWTAGGGIAGLGELAPTASLSTGFGVSADGTVVVGYENQGAAGTTLAFRWTLSGGMADLGDLPGGASYASASAVSDDGSVAVGGSGSTASGAAVTETEAFLWTAGGGMVGLGDLPGGPPGFPPPPSFDSFAHGISGDGSVVVGRGVSSSGTEAFRWTSTGGMVGLGDFPGGEYLSTATSASSDGSVVVGYGGSASGTEAFRWTAADGMVGLGDLPGGNFVSRAYDVSADGSVVVGNSWTTSGQSGVRAFIWDADNGMQRLDVVLASLGLDLTGWTLRGAYGISPDGRTIVGDGTNPDGDQEGWLAYLGEVPDPPAPPAVPALSSAARVAVALLLAAACCAAPRVRATRR